MASEYSLNLKATLDSSQVQQELQKLRQAQMAANSGTGQNGTGSGGMGNLTKLDTAITKLNSTVSGLQRSIESLARTLGRPVQGIGQGSFSASVGGRGVPVAAGPQAHLVNWRRSPMYTQATILANRYLDTLSPQQRRSFVARYGGGRDAVESLVMGGGFGRRQREEYISAKNAWYEGQRNSNEDRGFDGTDRKIASLIGGQLIAGAGNIARSMGLPRVGSALDVAGEGITAGGGAAYTVSMLGGSGALAGGVGVTVGLATAVAKAVAEMQQFADTLRKTSAALAENYDALHKRTLGVRETVQGIRQQDRADQLLQSGNIQEAKVQSKYWEDMFDSVKQQLLDLGDPTQMERNIRNRAETRKAAVDAALQGTNLEWAESVLGESLFKVFGQPGAESRKLEVKNRIDEEAQAEILRLQDRYKSLEDSMTQAKAFKGMYDEVVKAIQTGDKERFERSRAEVNARLALAERNDLTIDRYRAQGRLNQTQTLAESILDDKLLGPLQKFGKLSDELDKARGARNNALTQAFDIARNIRENGSSMTSEEMARQMKKQQRFEAEAAYAAQRISVLENALGGITNTTLKPDLSHVTSLAQYGFNMGERDDGLQRMDKYYSESINLQRQIKDKLNEGIKTEATYGD